MQITIPVASVATSPVLFPLTKEQDTATHLVAHWLKDQDGKLYRVWVSEKA